MPTNAPDSSQLDGTEPPLSFDPDNPASLDRLVPIIYEELRDMAHRHLATSGGNTIQTTALVHEAYFKLVDDTRISRQGRNYFFGAAARAMRQVLVDRARRRNAAKRGSGARHLDINEIEIGSDDFAAELLDLDAALTRLSTISERQSRVVECRFFGSMSIKETATALGLSESTVKTDWTIARAWLYRELSDEK